VDKEDGLSNVKESLDKGYNAIFATWNESVELTSPTALWQSLFISEGEGWDRETGVLQVHRVRRYGAATAVGATATVVVIGVVTVGIGILVMGGMGAANLIRRRRQRVHDRILGIVDWHQWQPEANMPLVRNAIGEVELSQWVADASKTFTWESIDTALTLCIAADSVSCTFALELYSEKHPSAATFNLTFHLAAKEKECKVEVFYGKSRVAVAEISSLARFRTSMAETFAKTEGTAASAPYHVWLALTTDALCVGFGEQALHNSSVWYSRPAKDPDFPRRFILRLATPIVAADGDVVVADDAELPTIRVAIGTQRTFPGALTTSVRRRGHAGDLIGSLEYHMHKKSGHLRVLRGQMYIYHAEREFRSHYIRIVVTSGHVVLMRRATGPSAKFHLHTQYRTLGIIDLASVFRIDKLQARYYDVDILKLDAVDGSTMLVPALSLETETVILWFMEKLDADRKQLCEKMPLLLRYSLLGECSRCKKITFNGEKRGVTLDGALTKLADCTCTVRSTRRTTIASIIDVDLNRRNTKNPNGTAVAAAAAAPPAASQPTRISRRRSSIAFPLTFSVRVACRDMMFMGEVVSPMCVVLQQKEIKGRQHWLELGRTEVVFDSRNPSFDDEITLTLPSASSTVVVEVHLINTSIVSLDDDAASPDGALGSPPRKSGLPARNASSETVSAMPDNSISSFYGSAVFTGASLMALLSAEEGVAHPIKRVRYERQRLGDVVLSRATTTPSQPKNALLNDVQRLVTRHGMAKKGDTVALLYAEVARTFSSAKVTPDDINFTLLNIEAEALQSILGLGASRAECNEALLSMLESDKTAPALTINVKVRLVCTVAPAKRATPLQHFLLRMITTTHGAELFKLKDGIDVDQSTQIDMSKLVFSVIQDKAAQDTVLLHLNDEAAKLVATKGFERPLRVLSDIDDTLVHSGFGLGGPKYKAGTILPGFVPLLRSLHARVAFVTARPAFIKKFTYKTLRTEYGIPDAVCLSGELIDSVLIPFAPDYSNEKISARKVGNIERYMQVFPECNFLWFGDSGQGDAIVGEKMFANPVTKRRLKGVFIQDVVKSDGYHFKTSSAERDAAAKKSSINIVDNYLDVALELYNRGYLTYFGLKRVAVATAKQVRALLIDPHDAGIIVARVLEHEKRLRMINKVLVAAKHHSKTVKAATGSQKKKAENMPEVTVLEEGPPPATSA